MEAGTPSFVGRGAQGFTLVETLVAAAIAVVIGFLMLSATSAALHWSAMQAQRDVEQAAFGELVDRWTAEEDSAWAIFTPPADVFGSPNTDGHEIDFFTRDGKNQSYFWAYDYDGAAHTLTRYRYSAPGATPVKDTTYAGITKFVAHTYPLTALQDKTTPVYSVLYANAALRNGIVHFYPSMPWIAGGNNITWLRVEGTSLAREMQLVTETAPTGFTVVLRYAPAPSATTGPLQAWPSYVELPVGGQALQTAYAQPRRDFGFYLNQFFGGAVADALSPCGINQGRAFQDAFQTVLANATAPADALPAGVTGYTDSSGCITINDGNGSNVELYELGKSSNISTNELGCGSAVVVASAIPGYLTGPHVGLRMQGATTPHASCSNSWKDSASMTAVVFFQVAGCSGPDSSGNYVAIGLNIQCAVGYSYIDDGNAGCDPSTGETSNGYTGRGTTQFSGPGTWDGTTFTRTGAGTATITVNSQYQRWTASLQKNGQYRCSASSSYITTALISIYD